MKKSEYFELYELVSPEVYKKYGERAWVFIDPRLIDNLDWLRKELGVPITVNSWFWEGAFEQRGLRENTSSIVKGKTAKGVIYLSGHVLGMAADFDVEGMEAMDVRLWIIKNKRRLPHPIRLEDGVNWVHMDVFDYGVKVYVFKP